MSTERQQEAYLTLIADITEIMAKDWEGAIFDLRSAIFAALAKSLRIFI